MKDFSYCTIFGSNLLFSKSVIILHPAVIDLFRQGFHIAEVIGKDPKELVDFLGFCLSHKKNILQLLRN